MSMETLLCELARKYGTDKGGHHAKYGSGRCHDYTPYYYEMWKDRREEPLTILEIGAQYGHSLRMWADFFPNAQVYGWDRLLEQYDWNLYPPDPRVIVLFADQSDANSMISAHGAMGWPKLDFIIDDGSHQDADQQLTMDVMIPYLAPGGVYCIEDNDTTQLGLNVFVEPPPEFYLLEVPCNRRPWHDSQLQVIRRA